MCHLLDVWLIIFSSKLKFNLMNHSSEFGYKYYLIDEVYFIMLAYTCFPVLIFCSTWLLLIKEAKL